MKPTMTALLAMSLLLAACSSDDETTTEVEPVEATTTAESAETTTTVEPTEPTTTTTQAPTTTTLVEDEPAAAGAFSLRDFRYCEILMTVTNEEGVEVTEVWGTPGVDPCTDEAWYALDAEAIRIENDASFIEMNGPRYFIVDGSAETGDGAGGTGTAAGGEAVIRQFGDVAMTLLATTEVTDESRSYVPDLVVRTTTWTFEAGSEIYELTDPDGNVYVMQSYSLIEDRTITAADLPALGDRLELPEGWSYASRVLGEPLQVALSPDGAFVVQDDLRNSYQRNG
ncbi:MAG: hypothetical protein AAGE98_02060 [Actinomycetota bacterium]